MANRASFNLPLALIGLCMACGDDAVVVNAGLPADSPKYVVFSTFETPDDRIGYFATTPSIEADAAIDVTRGLEEPGGGRLYAEPGIGAFLVGGGHSPTITRYEVGDDGQLSRAETLSFASYGVSDLGDDAVVFASPNKAYFRDRSQVQLISFDPTRMEILESFALPGLEREGFYTDLGATVLKRDGVLYFPVMWYDEQEDRGPAGAALVRIEPETDAIEITTDPRCSGMDRGLLTDGGDMYWFSTRVTTWWRAEPDAGRPRDCALRVRAGATTFDPDWQLDVTSRTNGWPSVATAAAGGSGMWLRVLVESEVPVPPNPTPDIVEGLPGWQWYLLDVESDAPAVRSDDRPLGSYYAYAFRVDGRTYTTENDAEYTQSTLLELDQAGFTSGPTLSGTVRGLARLK